jgi:hypothetical protein
VTLSEISSLASSVAVIITLVFLVIQTWQTNSNQRALMQQGRTARWMDIALRQTDPELAAALDQTWRSDMGLAASQVHAVNLLNVAILWGIEDSFLQRHAKLLDERSWATELATLRQQLSYAPMRVTWKMYRGNMTGDYRSFVDGLLNVTKPMRAWDELAEWRALMVEEVAAAEAP